MMANEEKMEQKQEGRKHNLKVFVIMIPLLIVSLLGLIVFSRENFKESVKEWQHVLVCPASSLEAVLMCMQDLKHLLQTISAPVLSISILMNTNSLPMEGKSHSGIIPERKGKIL